MNCSTTNKLQAPCPLCKTSGAFFYHSDKRRKYYKCDTCDLVFVPVEFHLSREAEKAEYDLHENYPNDSGYRKFLSRLATPMQERLEAGMTGLDFGCGPGPALAAMFKEAGFKISTYDPFYFPDKAALDKQYDFITCTEAIEHFANPDKELDKLFSLLKHNGILGIMTKLVRDHEAFKSWHYINDPTHISFFSKETFQWLAKKFHAECEFIGNDVIILTSQSA
tara:strand:+ start:306 stop:974 length:669 start_codon:yes stop_codon:yes gene_type:complete